MMMINTKSILRVLTLGILFGIFISVANGQQRGVVEKSNETVQVGQQVFYLHTIADGNTFYSLAKVYGISADKIKAANPGLDDTLKLGTVILIPKVNESTAGISSTYGANDKYFYHVVKKGESIFGIAKIFGVEAEELIRINELESSAITPGFYLKIPELDPKAIDASSKALPQEVLGKKDNYFEHKVQSKETLYSIAKHYGIGLETLKYINNFTGNDIRTGQMVLIPKAVKDIQVQESKKYVIHLVQPKEGLYGIARKYGVSIEQIKAVNVGLTNSIAIGQEIKIPRKANTKGYIEHQVEDRKEKLADIANEYKVSIDNLKELNPDASRKVKRGETVFIPVDFVDKKEVVLAGDQPLQEEVKVEQQIFTQDKQRVFKIALMLPLYLSEVENMQNMSAHALSSKREELNAFRFIEFYEGALIAIDSLRKLGMKLDVRVYDVNEDEMALAMMLKNPDLRNLDLIVSVLFSNSFAMVANFSKEYHIPLVNAISKRGQIVYENPYVYKLSPKPETKYNRVADFVGKNYPNSNIIIVRKNKYQLSDEYNLLYGLLQPKVRTAVNAVDYAADGFNGIRKHVLPARDNLIIALGSDEIFAIDLFTQLNVIRDRFKIKVFGLPDWEDFTNLDVEHSQSFALRVTSENFVDYNSPAAKRFEYKFLQAYNKVPEIETYSYLGYDATFYFLQALFRYGDKMSENITRFQIPLLQNQYRFKKIDGGGYENTFWNLYRQEDYRYNPEK